MKTIVFLGLSLVAAEAQLIFDADYRGPVTGGDLDAILPPARVVLIDGILDADERLTAEEVFRALDRGLEIYGASSIGAVLAIQLEHAGMKGSGRVFEAMRVLHGNREDLIMALYTTDHLKPLTVPLINAVVYCIERGLGPEQLDAVVGALSDVPLEARSWDRIEEEAINVGMSLPASIRLMDVKRDDARSLLQALSRCPSPGS